MAASDLDGAEPFGFVIGGCRMQQIEAQFLAMVRQNPNNDVILNRMATFGLADWWLTAGCLAQTVWNLQAGFAVDAHIADYDLFYFDDDTSFEAEDRVITQIARLFADLPVRVEIRNQARVPIWYAPKFGFPYGPVTCAADGIGRFAYQTTAIGVLQNSAGECCVYAPFGLENVMAGRIVPNPLLPVGDVYRQKTGRWGKIWPQLSIQPWPDDGPLN
jgi:hypothetical protein